MDLAVAARPFAKRSGVAALQAECAVMEAHGHAVKSDKAACIRLLREAEHAFSTSEGCDLPDWLVYFDHAYMAAKFAHTFHSLGMSRDAERFAHRSLNMSAGYERGRMFNTVLLASTLADQDRVDEACATGRKALDMMQNVRSVRGTTYLAGWVEGCLAIRHTQPFGRCTPPWPA